MKKLLVISLLLMHNAYANDGQEIYISYTWGMGTNLVDVYVTKDTIVKDLIGKTPLSPKAGEMEVLELNGKRLDQNSKILELLKDKGPHYSLEAVMIQRPVTQPVGQPTERRQARTQIPQYQMSPSESQSGMVTIELPGAGRRQEVITYNANDSIGDVTQKLRQKLGVGEKYEIVLFKEKLDPNASAQMLRQSDKIYAMDFVKR